MSAWPKATMMSDVKFYEARRDTRWDPYPNREPLCVVAHDWNGFWEQSAPGEWFLCRSTSFNLGRQITKEEAEQFVATNGTRIDFKNGHFREA